MHPAAGPAVEKMVKLSRRAAPTRGCCRLSIVDFVSPCPIVDDVQQTGDRAHLHEAMGKMASGLKISGDVSAAWSAVGDPSSKWIACVFDAADKTSVVLKEVGDGGYHAAVDSLREEDVTFVVFPFFLDGRPRWAFLTYVGAAVPAMRRGKVAMQKGAVYNAFPGAHCELLVSDRDELAESVVIGKLQKLMGAACTL